MSAALERIHELNGRLSAFVHLAPDSALDQARHAEAEISAGRRIGPLHGIPVALKDIFDVRGMPTRAGSLAFRAGPRSSDASLVARLRSAGAVLIGKTSMNEISCGGLAAFGEPRNPWNLNATPGGSSAGSAAAVAAALVPLAIGGDTGGSVRVPAAFCGVVGLRPTYGRVSRYGAVPLAWSLDQPGPIARSAADVELLLRAIAGADPRDPTTAGSPDLDSTPPADAELRVGVPWASFTGACSEESLRVFRGALDALVHTGATIVDVDMPAAKLGRAAGWVITYVEAFAAHQELVMSRRSQLSPEFVRKVVGGACFTGAEYLDSQRVRARIRDEFIRTLASVDVVATPATSHPAPAIGHTHPGGDPGRLARPASLTGLPALSIPCGFSTEGLPLGMQLIGRPWEDRTLFRLAAAFEQTTPWHRQTPTLTENPISRSEGGAAGAAAAANVVERVQREIDRLQLDISPDLTAAVAGELTAIIAELSGATGTERASEPLLWRQEPGSAG